MAVTCLDDEYECNDGECISSLWECDGIVDCVDEEDEQECSKSVSCISIYVHYDLISVTGNNPGERV